MIKYQIQRYVYGNKNRIEPVEVVKETAHFLTLRRPSYNGSGMSDSRLQKDWTFHDTFDSARNCLLERAETGLAEAHKSIARLTAEIEVLRALEPPTPPTPIL